MPPVSLFQWLRRKLYHKATTTTSTCLSFLLLVVSLLSPTWLEMIMPKTDAMTPNPMVDKVCSNLACSQLEGTSDTFKASRILLILTAIAGFVAAFSLLISCHGLRCYGRPPNMLVSSAASFAAGALGFVAMTLYTVDATQKEMGSIRRLHFTWSFCLTWMVFSLFIMNGLFSLLTYLLCTAPMVHRHSNPVLLGRRPRSVSGDDSPVRLSVLPSQEEVTTPGGHHFLGSSVCFSSTVI